MNFKSFFKVSCKNRYVLFQIIGAYVPKICSFLVLSKLGYDVLILYYCSKNSNMILYTIKLSQLEVEELTSVINKGSHTSQAFRSAYILLNCDKGGFSENTDIKNADICKILKIGERTIDRVKKKFIEEGFESVLERRPSIQNYAKKADGDIEAKIVSICCSEPPEGFAKWSLRLIAGKMVELNYVDYISHVTVGEVLKKTSLNHGK